MSLDGKGLLREENAFTVSDVEVLGENENRLVLKDNDFTVLEKKKMRFFTVVGQPSISMYTNDNCWGSGVKYLLYTFKRKKADTIKKEIEGKIRERFGYFMHGIDLSMIKEPANQEEK